VRSERGASAVEFAIIFPVLILIVFGIIDFGYAFFVRNSIIAAMREGARTAAAVITPGTAGADDPAKQRVIDYIRGTIDRNTTLTTANVSVDRTTNVKSVTVKLINGYTYVPLTPYANRLGLGNIVFRDSATFRWEMAD
jgi:Flp pilus assembly protein TadG